MFKFSFKNPKIINLTAVLAIGLLVFFAILAGNISDSRNSSTKIHELGEVVSYNSQFSVVVDKATINNDIAAKMHLPSENKVIVLHLKIKNLSNKKLDYMPIIHSYLRNNRGENVNFTPGLTDDTIDARLIDPGAELVGDEAFVISAEHTPLWFYFDAKFNNQGPIAISVVK